MSTPPPPPPPSSPVPAPGQRPIPVGGGGPAPRPGPVGAAGTATSLPTTTLPPATPGRWDRALRATWDAGRADPPRWALLGALAAGVLAAATAVGRPGLGAGLVEVLIWLPVAGLLVRRHAWADLALVTAGLVLLLTVVVRDAPWVVAIATATGLGAAAVGLTAARGGGQVLLAPWAVLVGAVRTFPLIGRLGRRVVGARREVLLRVLRSAAITVGLLLVFGALFAAADALFAAYLPRVDVGALPGRLVVGLVVAGIALGAAHLALAPTVWPDPAERRAASRLPDWLVPILALDALMVAFLAVQINGLVAGHGYVAATTGLTYAQYARAGFGQLVVVTALTLVVVAVAARRAPRTTTRDRVATTLALAVLGVGALGVVASALRRMALYVDAYGLTRLRLLVIVAEVVLGVILLLVLAAGVRWRGGWLPRAAVGAVVLGVGTLVALNPDAMIARYDLAAHDAPLDPWYLQGLSADAVPVLATTDEPLRSCVLPSTTGESTSWYGWNLGRSRAAGVLADVPADRDCSAVASG